MSLSRNAAPSQSWKWHRYTTVTQHFIASLMALPLAAFVNHQKEVVESVVHTIYSLLQKKKSYKYVLTCFLVEELLDWAPFWVGSKLVEAQWSYTTHSRHSLQTQWSICFWSRRSERPQKEYVDRPGGEAEWQRWQAICQVKYSKPVSPIPCPCAGSKKASCLEEGGIM